MNALFNQNNVKIVNINNRQSKEKSKNYLSVFSNIENSKNRYLSENQRNLTQFNSKKIIKKESHSKNKTNIKNKNKAFLVSLNDNNILKLYSNLYTKSSKIVKNNKNNTKNKSHYLSKPQIEIEINNINNSKNITNPKMKKYKKNISEYDLVSNILNSFNNSNFPKSTNNKANNKKNMAKARHVSDTKLLRSSSGYSYINNMAQTNSFFNGNHSNNLGYISTWGNSPDMTNINYKSPNKKNNSNNNSNKNKNNKEPIIGKIIKNYKNNDLNCIFNMNLIPPISPLNNIQDYFKNLYKIEYNSDYRIHKNKNNSNIKKENHNKKRAHKERVRDGDKDREKEIKTKSNNEDYSQSKNTMTKSNESKIKKEKYSIENNKYCNDSPEEIHFYLINSIQNSKNRICNLNKK